MKDLFIRLATTACFILVSVNVWAEDDLKGISGYGCFPQSGKFQSDFFFGGGAIINNANVTRNVVCTIFRDKYTETPPPPGLGFPDFPDAGAHIDGVRVYFQRDAAAGSTGLTCQALVRDLTTGAVMDSAVASSTFVGFGSISMPDLSFASEVDAVYLFCILPAKSRILGLRWEEDVNGVTQGILDVPEGGTDVEGEGLFDDGDAFIN